MKKKFVTDTATTTTAVKTTAASTTATVTTTATATTVTTTTATSTAATATATATSTATASATQDSADKLRSNTLSDKMSKFEKMKFISPKDTISAHPKHSYPTISKVFPMDVTAGGSNDTLDTSTANADIPTANAHVPTTTATTADIPLEIKSIEPNPQKSTLPQSISATLPQSQLDYLDEIDSDLVLRKTVSFQEKVVVNSYDEFQERVRELKRIKEESRGLSWWKRFMRRLSKTT
jgi:hypothetical protein